MNITVRRKDGKTGDNLVDRLEVIAADRKHIDSILKDGLTPAQQREKVRDLLMPDEAERYDAGMRLVKMLGTQKIPDDMIRDRIDFTVVENLPDESAEEIRQWLQKQGKDVRLYGSMVDWLYTRDVSDAPKPADIDIATEKSSKDSAEELAEIIRRTSGENVRVFERRLIEGYIVQIQKGDDWIDAVDIHHMDTYETKMPYGWRTKSAKVIDEVPTERLCEQLHRRGVTVLNPGVGIEGRGKIGPEAAHMPQRLKDIKKIQAVAKVLIKAAEREGRRGIAKQAKKALKKLTGEPAEGYPQVFQTSVASRPALAVTRTQSKPRYRRRRKGNYMNSRGRLVRQPRGAMVPGVPWKI